MIITICLLLQALTAWPSRESSLSGFPFGSSVAMTLLAMDALVERDLLSISAQPQGLKKTQRWRWICVIFFLEKLFKHRHLLLNRLFLCKEKKSSQNKEQRPMPSTFFFLAATTLVFVGRRQFVGAFEACMTLSMQHGRLNSAILFLAIARRSAFFFFRQRLCQLFRC